MLVAAKIIFTILLFILVEFGASKMEHLFVESSNGKLAHKFLETLGLSMVFGLFLFLLLR